MRTQYSLFIWSRILNSWLNYILILEKDVSPNVVSLEWVNVVEYVCHDQEGAKDGFFCMYMCHFSKLYMWIPFDDFTMGVLRLLNVTPT